MGFATRHNFRGGIYNYFASLWETIFYKLREKVVACSTVWPYKNISQLLEQETLGYSTPLQFLKRLQKLAERATDKSIFKHIFHAILKSGITTEKLLFFYI